MNEVWQFYTFPFISEHLIQSTSSHARQTMRGCKWLIIYDHWQGHLFLVSVEASGAGQHPRLHSIWAEVPWALPGEKTRKLSCKIRVPGEYVRQKRSEGATSWQHCIWCVEETARVKLGWPWSCLYQIWADLLGAGQCWRRHTRSKVCSQVLVPW